MEFLHKFHSDCKAYTGYPGNHNFYVCKGKIAPSQKLKSRYKKIVQHYPEKLTSFLDLSSCRGYFVLSASEVPSCERSLGIDINVEDVSTCKKLKRQFGLTKSQFEIMTLSDLAEHIGSFGGPFQTVVLANTYQYLYFGSDFGPGYLSHDKIFEYISQVCSDTFIYTNRSERDDCQNRTQVAQAGKLADLYNKEAILKAASKYFELIAEDTIGKYPLWVFQRRTHN
jgi:hypothetical protein